MVESPYKLRKKTVNLMAKFCAYCGSKLEENEKFCPHCGKPVEDRAPQTGAPKAEGEATEPAQTQAQKAPEQAPAAPRPPLAGASQFQVPEPPKSGSHKGRWALIILAVIVVGVGAGMLFGMNSNKSEAPAKPQQATEQKQEQKNQSKQDTQKKTPAKTDDAKKKTYGKIMGTDVRMRAEPTTDSAVLDYFDEGEKVEITETKGQWFQVKRSNGKLGYVSAEFCKKM